MILYALGFMLMKLRLNINQNVSIISAISSQIYVISVTHHLRLQPTIILIDYSAKCHKLSENRDTRPSSTPREPADVFRCPKKSKDKQFIKIQNKKEQQTCSSEQLEQILVCSVGVLII